MCQAASSRHQMVPNMILGSRVIITVIVVPIIVISSVNVIHIIVTNIIVISNHHFHYLQWLILVTTFTPVTNSQGIKPYWPKFCDSCCLVFPKKENAYYFHLDCLVAPCCARVPFHKIAARLIHEGPTNGIRVAGLARLNGRTGCGTLKHTPSTTSLNDCALQLGYTTPITTHILQGPLNGWDSSPGWRDEH